MNQNTTSLSWTDIQRRIDDPVTGFKQKHRRVFGIPRGGSVIAALLTQKGNHPVDDPDHADVFVDDLIDSGATSVKWRTKYPNKGFWAPIDKRNARDKDLGWIVFPWEDPDPSRDAEDTVTRLLQQIGENPNREGLKETPKRVVRSWNEIFAGYKINPRLLLKTTFSASGYDQMVILRDIEFHSTCEHHMLPFSGSATVAYIPGKQVVGLSKMARLVDAFSRRLQIQERLTQQVADTLQAVLKPRGVGVIMKAKHHCMLCRGVEKQHGSMVTSALLGAFREPAVRQEFLQLAQI
jgi:GTP cyclohydrolase I